MSGDEEPTESEIRTKMEKLVPKVDLETMTTKQFIEHLSTKMGGVDLTKKKKFIKKTITEILDAMDDDPEEEEEEEEEEDESEEEVESESEEEEEEVRKKKQPKKGKRRSGGASGGGGGLAAVKEISDSLATFLGQGKHMARTDVVKALWAYIKENDLQNPNDKREIILDDKMKNVFGCDTFTMFSMNKYVGAHIEPYKPVDLTATSSSSASASKKKRKAAATQSPKGGGNKKGKKTNRKQGTQAPYRLSEQLAEVVGKDILPRPQVTQALWVYIRKHGLQNPDDKREILCDTKLRAVMGGNKKVTMFSMNKHITPHMIEKLDKSEYVHEMEEEEQQEEQEDESEEEQEEEESEQEEDDSD